jgi:hypothetical protein
MALFHTGTRRLAAGLALAGMVAAAAVGAAFGPGGASAESTGAGHGSKHYTVGLFGDMPYGDLGKAQYPNLLADMNQHQLAFSVFDGDLKAGGDGMCTDDLYSRSLSYFNLLQRPVVFTPGDNDWTDCWGRYGPGTGGYDPEGRLDLERQVFFSAPRSLGRTTMRVRRESDEGGAYAAYSENALWKWGPVVYATVNVQGSNDNYAHTDNPEDVGAPPYTRSPDEIARQDAEHFARLDADRHWLDVVFDYASSVRAKGVMLVWQADPNFNNEQHLAPDEFDGFTEIVAALRAHVMAFDGQVVLVHGDSHYFKVDQPLKTDTGGVLANFTRVETWGSRDTHWVTAEVDPDRPTLFTFRSMIVPANVG